MKKKIAILLSGHMRSYELTYESLRHIIKELSIFYDVDIFVHTWNIMEPETPTHHAGPSKIKNKPITEEDVKNTYNPSDFLIEQQNIENDSVILYNQSFQGLVYAEYSKYMVNELKRNYENKHHFKYDLVICSRPDVAYYRNFNQDELDQTKKIWICTVGFNGAASDVLLFSSSNNVNLVRSYYHVYKDYLETLKFQNNESHFNYYLGKLETPKQNSSFVMPTHWKIVRSWWGKDDDDNWEASQDPMSWSTSFWNNQKG